MKDETTEFVQTASRLLYGFMLDCNSVGAKAAGENLARGLKHQISVIAQRELGAANLTSCAISLGIEHVGWQQRYIDKEEGASVWQFCDNRTATILKGRRDYELRPVYA